MKITPILQKKWKKRKPFTYTCIRQLPFIIKQWFRTKCSHFVCSVSQNGSDWLCLNVTTLLGIFGALIGKESEYLINLLNKDQKCEYAELSVGKTS